MSRAQAKPLRLTSLSSWVPGARALKAGRPAPPPPLPGALPEEVPGAASPVVDPLPVDGPWERWEIKREALNKSSN